MNVIDILQELTKREYHNQVWNLGLTISKYSDGFQVDYWESRTDKKVAQGNHHLSYFCPFDDYPKLMTDEEYEQIHHATRLTCLAMDAIIKNVYDAIVQKNNLT